MLNLIKFTSKKQKSDRNLTLPKRKERNLRDCGKFLLQDTFKFVASSGAAQSGRFTGEKCLAVTNKWTTLTHGPHRLRQPAVRGRPGGGPER
jgi:hypothetical protein